MTTTTPTEAEKLARKNAANIVRKMNDGKTLTAAELRFMEDRIADQDRSESRDTVDIVQPSQARMAALLRIPESIIKRSKNEGADGFRSNGKVNIVEWLSWMFSRGEEGVDWSRRWTQAKAQREELRYEVETGATCKSADAAESFNILTVPLLGAVEKIFAQDLPPLLVGMDAATISKRCQEEVRKLEGNYNAALANLVDTLKRGLAAATIAGEQADQPQPAAKKKTKTARKQTKILGSGDTRPKRGRA